MPSEAFTHLLRYLQIAPHRLHAPIACLITTSSRLSSFTNLAIIYSPSSQHRPNRVGESGHSCLTLIMLLKKSEIHCLYAHNI